MPLHRLEDTFCKLPTLLARGELTGITVAEILATQGVIVRRRRRMRRWTAALTVGAEAQTLLAAAGRDLEEVVVALQVDNHRGGTTTCCNTADVGAQPFLEERSVTLVSPDVGAPGGCILKAAQSNISAHFPPASDFSEGSVQRGAERGA
jgi:hypothetical protein